MPSIPWWITANRQVLAQGDLLSKCLVPILDADFDSKKEAGVLPLQVGEIDLIIATQSCDLENRKVSFVSLCPIHSLEKFSEINPIFKNPNNRDELRKGRREGIHLLASPIQPEDNNQCLVVDFRHIISLPLQYLERHAESLGERWTLQTPFLEHFSQSLARSFMRVGLPNDALIKEFK